MKDFHKDFQNSKEAHWLERHVAEYGFIIRYPKGQSKQTGSLIVIRYYNSLFYLTKMDNKYPTP